MDAKECEDLIRKIADARTSCSAALAALEHDQNASPEALWLLGSSSRNLRAAFNDVLDAWVERCKR